MRTIKSFKTITKHSVLFVLLFLLSSQFSVAQETIRIMAYNVLNYQKSSLLSKKTALFNVIDLINPDPDILIGIEIDESPLASDDFRLNVLNPSVTDKYFLGSSSTTSATGGYSNYVYYKPEKFTFLSDSIVVDNGKWPTLQFQLYNNLTGNKIIIYGAHFTSLASGGTQREVEANAIRNSTALLASTSYYIIAGDLNLVSGSTEGAYSILLDSIPPAPTTGYFLDPGNFNQIYKTFKTSSINDRYDFILNSVSVVNSGGISYNSNSFIVDGNDGVSSSAGTPYTTASDHLPVYADFTFDFPTTKNPPYPGSIVFTQVGSTSADGVIEFMTLYRMDLTTLKITDNSIDINGNLSTTEGTFDLSNRDGFGDWNDVPGGTFVRLGSNLTTNDIASDRLLVYDGTGSGTLPALDIGGEQLIAYTGSSLNPTYIAGINWGNNGGWLTNPTGTQSYAPGTPSDISLGTADDYYYTSSVNDILYVTRNSLTNSSNWGVQTNTGSYATLTGSIGNSALPVELTFFAATLNGNNVELRWRTETEVNNYGFDIERTKDNSDWLTIGFVEGNGNSNSPKQYSFSDNDINLSGEYYYRLKQIDNDGTYEYSDVVTVEVGVPNNFYLSQNYPNPFNPETRIDFTLPEKQLISLRIYNMLGELVGELVNEEREAGSYSVIFDASKLPSGVYIYRLQTSSFAANKKMTLLK